MLYSPLAQRVMMEASKDAEGDDYTDDEKIARMAALRDLLNSGRLIVYTDNGIALGSILLDDPCGIVTIGPDGHIALRFDLRDKAISFTRTGSMSYGRMLTSKGEGVMDLTIGLQSKHDIIVSDVYAIGDGWMRFGECFVFHADTPHK